MWVKWNCVGVYDNFELCMSMIVPFYITVAYTESKDLNFNNFRPWSRMRSYLKLFEYLVDLTFNRSCGVKT